jgi:thioredoxin-like negative regulator of GroEL
MMADAYMAMGDVEEAHKWVKAAARHAKAKGAVGYIRHIATLGIL